ncbi:hypothetical protein I302_104932 [Kwoniella bestiolae CBS 10118]|uniref:Crossover junction endonuclease MUS81 n=1 Tax=Kwoniella bestiolae CBS 10118 TaxID=1296100 RepID=A0A1B9FRD3_9TREE|nr:hypothetical protein I302_08997 [Kwoniella bestiolae CBS 10118]OCF21323.1 hypothetical protein I302_08997 [Kwoniella bestiolae CBS 10118]
MPREKPPCGNPIFLKWMEELRDAAREKNMKSAEGYNKACRSLQNCPVTYSRPRELVVLQHIGEKTVAILEKKWKVYCEENNIVVESPAKSRNKGKSRSTPSDDDSHDSSTETAPKKKARKASKPKAYIPARGSGSYGILMSLVLAIDNPQINTQVFLTKSEVIRGAQDYCDSSYDHSEKGTYFTAWSGMKTLVNKGYVYVTGNPHKYCLTEEGYDVAVTMRNLRPELGFIEKHPFLHTPAVGGSNTPLIPTRSKPSAAPTPIARMPSDTPSRRTSPEKPPARSKAERFQFWYIDSSGNRVPSLTSASIRLDPTEFTNLRKVEFKFSQRSHPFASQLRLVDCHSTATIKDGSGQSTLFGFIVEEEAPPTCSKFDETPASATNKKRKSSGSPILDLIDGTTNEDEEEDETLVSISQIPKAQPISPYPIKDLIAAERTFARTVSAPANPQSPISNQAAEAALRRQVGGQSSNRSHSLTELERPPKTSRPAPRLSSHVPNPTVHVHLDQPLPSSTVTPADKIAMFQPSDAIVYPPGSYEIVLVVDTREVESKSNRDKIAETLAAKGIKVETRALRLGDMCWVARRTVGDLGGEEDECVLDYVVERKRLDDLCSSIRDGRYNEQCFRLSNSCINHIYYIVEDWQVTERMEYHGLQIMTAKSQIQIHNRFFLKETHKLSETIDFLTTMTKVIQSSYRDKPLHVIPTRCLSRSTYKSLQSHLRDVHPDKEYLTTFGAYQELNDKSASVTLKEKFARMLLCVKGMSAERVSSILDIWDTPRSLFESLKERDSLPSEIEVVDEGSGRRKKRGKEMFFADRVRGEGRRKIGDALSRELWKAFMGSDDGDR